MNKVFLSPVAGSIPVDNSGLIFRSTNLQDLAAELKSQYSYNITNVTSSASGTYNVLNTTNSVIIVTGTASSFSVRLPDATTCFIGQFYEVWNLSSQPIDIRNNGSVLLTTLRANGRTQILLRDNSTVNGIWGLTYTLDSGNVFGSEVTFVQDETETSTTSNTTYSTKLTLTTPSSLPLGDYLISFQFIWRTSNADREMDVRIRHGTTTLAEWVPSASRVLNQELISGFLRVPSISGSNTFTLEFRRNPSTGTTTIFMRQARMFIWRIA